MGASDLLGFPRKQDPVRSEIRVYGGNGHGAVATKIRRMSVVYVNIGDAIIYTDSPSMGGSCQVTQDGVYCVMYSDAVSSGSFAMGLSINSKELTTSVASITAASILDFSSSSGANVPCKSIWYGNLKAGDTVRMHTDGGPNNGSIESRFSMVKVSN